MAAVFGTVSGRVGALLACAAVGIASTAIAQQNAAPAAPNSATILRLPDNPELFGTTLPSVVKATAIINGEVITQTDIDQRVAMVGLAQGGNIPAEEVNRLRQQVVANLIDELLQIQAARREKVEPTRQQIDTTLERFARNLQRTPDQLAEFLEANGTSIRSVRRQIEGELAWQRLQQAKIEVTVGEDEVNTVLERMNQNKGSQQYRVGEIYLSAPQGNQAQAIANAGQILAQLRNGGSFTAYARQYSEASTAAVGGDLGWVRPEQLPEPLAGRLRAMAPGQISDPIPVAGGVSILAVQDTRRIQAPDPRDAVFTLKQVTLKFAAGTTRQQVEPIFQRFAAASQNVGGCGGADKLAADFNAEVVESDQIKLRDLPPFLQNMMLPMQVGQATQPFGTMEDGVRVLVICGRDEVNSSEVTYDDIYSRLNEERVNSRARRYLRDLRRDAVIEFR